MGTTTTRITSLLAGTALAVAAFASPASAAPGATIDGVDRDGCDLTINVTTEDPGTYYLVIYDDSELLESTEFTPASAGASIAIPYTIVSNVSAGQPGVGIYVSSTPTGEAGTYYAVLDPYDFPNSGDIAQACAEAATSTTTTSTSTTSTPVAPSTTEAAPVTTAPPAVQGTAGAPAARPISGTAAYTG